MNRFNIIMIGFGCKGLLEHKASSSNFTFENGMFHSYNLKIAFFQEEHLIILDYTAATGCAISQTTSVQVNKIKEYALRCNISHDIVNPNEYLEGDENAITWN